MPCFSPHDPTLGSRSHASSSYPQPAASAGSAHNSRSASPARSTGSGAGNYSRSELEASAAQKEQFFASRMAANATRPDHLPPNQVQCNLKIFYCSMSCFTAACLVEYQCVDVAERRIGTAC